MDSHLLKKNERDSLNEKMSGVFVTEIARGRAELVSFRQNNRIALSDGRAQSCAAGTKMIRTLIYSGISEDYVGIAAIFVIRR